MNRTLAIALLAAAAGAVGCAATDPSASTAPQGAANEEYVTGSRLPRKSTGEPQKGMSKEDWRLESGRGIGNAPKGN
ncbi:MAG: hypothetical protein AB7P08_04880 [Burkholderiales bacterium]